MSAERTKTWLLGAIAAGCVALQVGGALALSSAALVFWLAALLAVEPRVLRRLWLPRFWLAGFVVVAASALLLEPRDLELAGLALSSRGLAAGALMMIRGTFIFGLAAWASTALAGSGWLRWCRRLGAERFGTAVQVAFGLLPALQRELRELRRERARTAGRLRAPLGLTREAAVEFVVRVARLAERLAAEECPPGPGPTSARP
jgi:hypothetical protein